MDPVIEDYWSPSPHRVSVPDAEGESVVGVLDLGKITSEVLSRDVCFEVFRCRIYWDNPDFRPTTWLPAEPGVGLPFPNIPPSVFPVPWCVSLWSGRSVSLSLWFVSTCFCNAFVCIRFVRLFVLGAFIGPLHGSLVFPYCVPSGTIFGGFFCCLFFALIFVKAVLSVRNTCCG